MWQMKDTEVERFKELPKDPIIQNLWMHSIQNEMLNWVESLHTMYNSLDRKRERKSYGRNAKSFKSR